MRRICYLLALLCLSPLTLTAHGKVDVGPIYLNIKVLENGATVESLDMLGVRGDATIQIYKAFCIKPMVTYSDGKAEFFTSGLNAGVYIPISDCLAIMPTIGGTYSYLKTHIDRPLLGLSDIKEKFRSWAPAAGAEVTYTMAPFRLSATFQYGWSRTHTTMDSPIFGRVLSAMTNGQGPIVGVVADYMLTDQWSVNLSGGYNLSQTKEKHGFKARGVRIGIGYTY